MNTMGLLGWGFLRCVGFRFGILIGALLVFPFPLGAIPKGTLPGTERVGELLNRPWEWAVSWFAQSVLGLADPSTVLTGSGDRPWNYIQHLVIAILATLGTIVWSVVDRRRTAYPRLADGAQVVLRYYLASAMLFYGIAKILRLQFPDLAQGWLDLRVGELPPMGLLWTFMGHSLPYTIFAGLLEALGGVLLLWRRTATIGALVTAAVMTNVVMLNFCYDVPAKLYSSQLLVMAMMIALPSARRLIAAAIGRATPEVAPRARMAPEYERSRRIAKIVMLGTMACSLCLSFREDLEQTADVHEIHGTWIVDSFTAGEVEHPPLTTDAKRWRAISASRTRLWIMPMTGDFDRVEIKVDEENRTVILRFDDQGSVRTEIWNYTRTGSDHLVIDGEHRGEHLHVTLHRQPAPLLVTRGFHWVNERPVLQ
jgi:uncharacterized membrane protein YphA (DoxX/SURF4 family)